MKIAFAVILALMFLIIGWFGLYNLVVGIKLIAIKAQNGIEMSIFRGLINVLTYLIGEFLTPFYGGFLAVSLTSKIFKGVDTGILTKSIISITIILGIILFAAPFFTSMETSIWSSLAFILQIASIIVGAIYGQGITVEIAQEKALLLDN